MFFDRKQLVTVVDPATAVDEVRSAIPKGYPFRTLKMAIYLKFEHIAHPFEIGNDQFRLKYPSRMTMLVN